MPLFLHRLPEQLAGDGSGGFVTFHIMFGDQHDRGLVEIVEHLRLLASPIDCGVRLVRRRPLAREQRNSRQQQSRTDHQPPSAVKLHFEYLTLRDELGIRLRFAPGILTGKTSDKRTPLR